MSSQKYNNNYLHTLSNTIWLILFISIGWSFLSYILYERNRYASTKELCEKKVTQALEFLQVCMPETEVRFSGTGWLNCEQARLVANTPIERCTYDTYWQGGWQMRLVDVFVETYGNSTFLGVVIPVALMILLSLWMWIWMSSRSQQALLSVAMSAATQHRLPSYSHFSPERLTNSDNNNSSSAYIVYMRNPQGSNFNRRCLTLQNSPDGQRSSSQPRIEEVHSDEE